MKTAIAIYLILKFAGNLIKLPQIQNKDKNEAIAHVLVELVLMFVHLWFALWLLNI